MPGYLKNTSGNRQPRFYSAQLSFAGIAVNATSSVNFSVPVPQAVLGNTVAVSFNAALVSNLAVYAYVSAPGVVTVRVNNPSAAQGIIQSGTLSVAVFES